jgi:nucleotide-binding universal stress UspA family protein
VLNNKSSVCTGGESMHSNTKFHETEAGKQLSSAIPRRLQFKRIVVGFDHDNHAQVALAVADAIAKELHSELIIVHSALLSSIPLAVSRASPQAITQHVVRKQELMEEAIREARIQSEYRVLVRLDAPATTIRQVAAQQDADLVIVGTHGRHGLEQLIAGSVSQTVAGKANCPVLILGPEFSSSANLFQTILFASDLNETGVRAAQYAGALACDFCCRLVLLHVIAQKPRAENRMREWVEENTSEKLFNLLDSIDRLECDHEALIAYGEPEQEILAAADSKHADLIILGGGDQQILGDHAAWRTLTKVVRHARCPILRVGASSK